MEEAHAVRSLPVHLPFYRRRPVASLQGVNLSRGFWWRLEKGGLRGTGKRLLPLPARRPVCLRPGLQKCRFRLRRPIPSDRSAPSYVIEPTATTQTRYPAGDLFEFTLLLFGEFTDYLPYFIYAFESMGDTWYRRPASWKQKADTQF
jgi:hypothetical protein